MNTPADRDLTNIIELYVGVLQEHANLLDEIARLNDPGFSQDRLLTQITQFTQSTYHLLNHASKLEDKTFAKEILDKSEELIAEFKTSFKTALAQRKERGTSLQEIIDERSNYSEMSSKVYQLTSKLRDIQSQMENQTTDIIKSLKKGKNVQTEKFDAIEKKLWGQFKQTLSDIRHAASQIKDDDYALEIINDSRLALIQAASVLKNLSTARDIANKAERLFNSSKQLGSQGQFSKHSHHKHGKRHKHEVAAPPEKKGPGTPSRGL